MNALEALARCQRAWEATQPQLFMDLWPDDGLDDTHADSRSCGSGEPVCVVEPGAAASPEAAGLEPRLSERGGPGLAHGNARTGTHEPTPCSLSRVLNPGDTEPRRAYVHGELTVPRAAPPPPPAGGGSVSPLIGEQTARTADVGASRDRWLKGEPSMLPDPYTTAPGRKTSQSSAAGGRR